MLRYEHTCFLISGVTKGFNPALQKVTNVTGYEDEPVRKKMKRGKERGSYFSSGFNTISSFNRLPGSGKTWHPNNTAKYFQPKAFIKCVRKESHPASNQSDS
jgi:hypothetical protein